MGPGPFRLPLRKEPWANFGGWTVCPVCLTLWRPWRGSYLPCHAKCLLTDEAQDELADELGVGQAEQAERLGVTVAVIRASIAASLKRRRGAA